MNILLLGSDQRQGEGGYRTDTILLLTINPTDDTVHLTSFPRDTFVYIPGWTMQRLNTAQPRGGFELTQQTFEYNFGFRPDFFVLVNFWGFEQGIDSLGGIYVNSAAWMSDQRDGYGLYSVPQGRVYMDGATALWYVRARYATSDYDRTRRQQEVLVGAFERLISLDAIGRAPELYELYRGSAETNMDLEDGLELLPVANRISQDQGLLRSFYIDESSGSAYTLPGSGAWVFLPDREAVRQILQDALNAQ